MKRTVISVLCTLPLLFTACTFVPQTGMLEKKWLRHAVASDLVYIEGNVKAYRSDGTYYYFRDGALVKVNPSLLSPDKLP